LLGLEVLRRDAERIHLGAAGNELVVLEPGAAGVVPQGTTGLYHLAIVVPNRGELARVIGRLAQYQYPQSPTDHVMTKSDYVWDPDGNGIEVYAETPEDGTFSMSGDSFSAIDRHGVVRSGRDPIDIPELFSHLEASPDLARPMATGTRMGHIHLHVRDIDEAVHFWCDLVGFDVMGRSARFGAAFVSAGGYHHHLGLNTWQGVGAPPPPADLAGMRFFTIELPTAADLAAVDARLRGGGVSLDRTDAGFFVDDPSGNRAHLVSPARR
jgi:catechol 2,3-dioxygenase